MSSLVLNSNMDFVFTISDGKLFHTVIVLIANEFNLVDLTRGVFSFKLCPVNWLLSVNVKKLAHVNVIYFVNYFKHLNYIISFPSIVQS